MSTIPQVVADFEVQLSTAVSNGSVSFSISSKTDDDGNLISDGKYCFTVDNGQSNKEYLLGDLVGTTVSNVLSVSRQGVETSGAVRAHRVGASVILTDFVTIQRVAQILGGTSTLDGGHPISYDATPALSDGKQLATVAYVLSVVTGGTVNFNNQIITGVTAGETFAANSWVYFKTSDQRWYKTVATDNTKVEGVKFGVALSAGTAGNPIVSGIQLLGIYTTSGLTAGSKYFLSNTSGALSTEAAGTFTYSVFVGWALSTTVLLIAPRETQIPTAAQLSSIATGLTPTGSMLEWPMYTAPTGYLMCDGSAISRTTYAALFAILCPTGTFTVTIASPAVFTKVAHGLKAGDKIHITTTGGFPSGLAAATEYFVISAGLAADTFRVALSVGGPAINTTGSQSGVHTLYLSPWGIGDGSTTFNVPDFRGAQAMPIGQFTHVVRVDSSNVTLASPSVFTVPADVELHQGQPIVLTTTGALPTGFSSGSTYYVIRGSNQATTFTLAASLSAANAGTGVNGSVSQSGVHILTYTAPASRTIVGRGGGEEMHGNSVSELAGHIHPLFGGNPTYLTGGGGTGNTAFGTAGGAGPPSTNIMSPNTPADGAHNNMSPFKTIGGKIIKT